MGHHQAIMGPVGHCKATQSYGGGKESMGHSSAIGDPKALGRAMGHPWAIMGPMGHCRALQSHRGDAMERTIGRYRAPQSFWGGSVGY